MGSFEEMREEKGHEVHVVVLPCPTQGHINPLLQFAKHLLHRGLKVTLPVLLTNSNHSTHLPFSPSLTIDHVSLLPYEGTEPESFHALWERRHASLRLHLTQLLTSHQERTSNLIACVVYDSVMPWILDILKQFGVLGAVFFTQSCAVNSIFYNINKGWLNFPLEQSSVSLDGFPVLRTSDLPSFVSNKVNYPTMLNFMSEDQFARLNDVDWIFANTFDSLEFEEVEWMKSHLPFKNIGPMLPSIYLDGRLQNDRDYGLNLFESNVDCTMNWLDSKGERSVIYVSFGSSVELGKDQMEELALGLKLSNKFFLWVVRESEIHKLPANFMEETAEKGLVVKWCPQLKVLAHKSVGCFITHCGWNSTLEGLTLGVPLVTIAQWTDQPTNAKYVEDVWKVGKRVRMDQDGICTGEQIDVCVNEVMGGEDSKDIRENLKKWKELAKAAMDEGGSSNRNINDFVQQLLSRTLT